MISVIDLMGAAEVPAVDTSSFFDVYVGGYYKDEFKRIAEMLKKCASFDNEEKVSSAFSLMKYVSDSNYLHGIFLAIINTAITDGPEKVSSVGEFFSNIFKYHLISPILEVAIPTWERRNLYD